MSDIKGPVSLIGVPVLDQTVQFRFLPPHKQSVALVGYVTVILVWWVYLGPSFVAGLLGMPSGTAGNVRLIWAAGAVPLLLLLLALLRLARGQRDQMAALVWPLHAAVFAALLWGQVYPDPRTFPLVAFLLKGSYWAGLVANLARAYAAAQPFGDGSAKREFDKSLRERNAPLLPARRRRSIF